MLSPTATYFPLNGALAANATKRHTRIARIIITLFIEERKPATKEARAVARHSLA